MTRMLLTMSFIPSATSLYQKYVHDYLVAYCVYHLCKTFQRLNQFHYYTQCCRMRRLL